MKIVRCDDSYRDAWTRFVDTCGSFYHRFEWRYINRQCFGHGSCYLAAVEHDRIVGVLPIARIRSRLFGNVACSLPFVNYGGPCSLGPDVDASLVQAAARVAEEWNVDYLELRSLRHLGANLPTSDHKVALTVDLRPGIEGLWKAFTHSHRKDIKRGYRNGFSVAVGGVELLDEFYDVLTEAWRDKGTPIHSKRYFDAVATTFQAMVRLCIVRRGSVPVAASFQAHDRGVAEGLWLGSRSKERHDYAGYVLYWELLQDAVSRGCTRFHLGRSSAHSGAETFKKKWNAELTQLYWQYVLRTRSSIPRVNPSSPKYRVALTAWRRLPVSVANSVGPLLAPRIP